MNEILQRLENALDGAEAETVTVNAQDLGALLSHYHELRERIVSDRRGAAAKLKWCATPERPYELRKSLALRWAADFQEPISLEPQKLEY